MSDLGDLSGFLKDSAVSNLDWLDVNEKDYRDADRLPKQNLEISPDLEAVWSHEDKPSTFYLEPNKDKVHTMGDLGPGGPLRAKAEDILKTARLAIMVSSDMGRFREQMLRKFHMEDLRAHRGVIASVLSERGLLGGVYVSASDFKGCHNAPKNATEFVRRHASEAKFVEAKPECGSCVHANKAGATTNCAVFHKQIVPEIPYSEGLAQEYERKAASFGRQVQASTADPKERIKNALLSDKVAKAEPVYNGIGQNQLPAVPKISSQEANSNLISVDSLLRMKKASDHVVLKAKPIIAFLRQEMLKGRTASELAANLKVSFPLADLTATRTEWQPLFNEVGLYGSVYSTQDSFDDCRVGADTLAKHNPSIRVIEAGAKCGSCIYNKISRCMMYGKPLVTASEDVITWETVDTVLDEHRMAGRIQPWDTKTASWGETPRQVLKALHTATKAAPAPQYAPGRMDIFHTYAGSAVEHVSQAKRNVVKTASRYLNEGLYGQDLLSALKKSFEVRDLKASASDLKMVIAEQGLQGIYYIKPSVYDDYGHGCKEASRLFRAKLIPYVQLESKCGSCVHNTNQHCAQLNKPLVAEVPYIDKLAQQRAMLATGPASSVAAETIINSGLTMMQEYQLQNSGDIELAPEVRTPHMAIELGRGKMKL
jgi:hypothetical protein